jgi:hypothetical protein
MSFYYDNHVNGENSMEKKIIWVVLHDSTVVYDTVSKIYIVLIQKFCQETLLSSGGP